MRTQFWILLSVIGLGVMAVAAGQAWAAAGSGQSADNRNDDFVVICHYDRNLGGPNAGPHTITINVSSLDHHLENHVKKEGFVGDDSIGPCPGDPPATQTAPASTRTPGSTKTAPAGTATPD